MLRFLIIMGLLVYVFYKVGSFFFRAGAASQELKDIKEKQQRTKASTKSQKGKVNGGDYVDYEEVK